jgi:hypothetical protein
VVGKVTSLKVNLYQMKIETELMKSYEDQLLENHPKAFADWIISKCQYSLIHADYIESCEAEIEKYGISFYLMSDDFYYYDADDSVLNVDAILQDREELLEFLEESEKSEMLHDLLNYLASSV